MYPFLTRYRQNFGKINQEGSLKRCQDKVLTKLTTAAATTWFRLCRKKKKKKEKKHSVKSRALTIWMENSEICCTICLDKPAQRKRELYRYFVNGTTQSRSCFRCKKNTSTIWPKFSTEIFVQMITARGITFFPFLPKRAKFSVPFVWISARLQVERKRKIYRYFLDGITQSCSCLRCPKKYRHHLTEIFDRKFPYKW